MADFEFPCCVEYAKSDRSRCYKCGSQILKQEVRIGQQYDRDHSSYRWYHLECFQHARNFPKTAKSAEEFLFGYERISSIDQKRVSRSIEKAIYHRDHGGSGADEQFLGADDDDEEECLKPKAKKQEKKVASPQKKEKKKEYREKEKEPEYATPSSFGFSLSVQPQSLGAFVDTTNTYDIVPPVSDAFIGFDTKPTSSLQSFGFDTKPALSSFGSTFDKENSSNFLNAPSSPISYNIPHQVFASSPLKSAHTLHGDTASFLSQFKHRLTPTQISWLSSNSSGSNQVKRAVEAAQALYNLDGDEEDLVDTLVRVHETLQARKK